MNAVKYANLFNISNVTEGLTYVQKFIIFCTLTYVYFRVCDLPLKCYKI